MPALVRTGSGRLLKRTQSDSGIHELTQLLGQRGESSASGGAVEGITMPFVIVAEVTDGTFVIAGVVGTSGPAVGRTGVVITLTVGRSSGGALEGARHPASPRASAMTNTAC